MHGFNDILWSAKRGHCPDTPFTFMLMVKRSSSKGQDKYLGITERLSQLQIFTKVLLQGHEAFTVDTVIFYSAFRNFL